ncbi:cytochrome c peroxidase [Xanthobacter sp. V2C-8]|uniref:cytochrome-c peroxidase n=1 Tax=Xanthobacter albus TaxID=3119929 RepID=UPI00372A87EF
MRGRIAGAALLCAMLAGVAVAGPPPDDPREISPPDLRRAYSGPPRTWPAPWLDADVAFVELGAPPPAPPAGPEAALGARLFGEPRLSADGTVACASCHDPAHGFSVPDKVGTGIGGAQGRRNPPALFSVARRAHLDWDGGGGALAARVLTPLAHPREMGPSAPWAPDSRLAAAGYAERFSAVFGAQGLSEGTLARALVAYLETIDPETRLDRFARGEAGALTDTELFGLHLFRTKARCANCHFGPLLTDEGFHNLRFSFFGEPAQDLGRHGVTGAAEDAGRFRTASLRHVESSAPYMHNGLIPTLEGVINFYDRGGGEVWARNAAEAARPLYRKAARLSPHIRPLHLTPQEKAALAAFLRAL